MKNRFHSDHDRDLLKITKTNRVTNGFKTMKSLQMNFLPENEI